MPDSAGYSEDWPALEPRASAGNNVNAPAPRAAPAPAQKAKETDVKKEGLTPQKQQQQQQARRQGQSQQFAHQVPILKNLAAAPPPPPPRKTPLRGKQRAPEPSISSASRPVTAQVQEIPYGPSRPVPAPPNMRSPVTAQAQEIPYGPSRPVPAPPNLRSPVTAQVQEIPSGPSRPVPTPPHLRSPDNTRQANALPVGAASIDLPSNGNLPPSRTPYVGIGTHAGPDLSFVAGPSFALPTGPGLRPSPGPSLPIADSSQNTAPPLPAFPPPTSPWPMSLPLETGGNSPGDTGPRTPVVYRPTHLPLVKNDKWKKYPEVDVRIGPNLAKHVTIKHIYITVKDFGDVDSIFLDVDISGNKQGTAKVRFRKVYEPFWENMKLDFGAGLVQVRLEKPRGGFFVQSRVNPSKYYPMKLMFPVESIEFGFMFQPEEFMPMYKTKPDANISWEVNLQKKRIEMTFRLEIDRTDAKTSEGITVETDYDRVEKYMIEIPFTQLQDIFIPVDEDESSSKRTFIIPLPDPPKISRLLQDLTKSMNEASLTRWSIYDAWMRQTDIEYDMRARQERPVSLRHKNPIIDIGRWTTYRLSFDLQDEKLLTTFKLMMEALQDFNVRKKPLETFRVNKDKSTLNPIWSYLDPPATTSNSELLKSHLEFPVRYQLEVCISHGLLNEYNLAPPFIDRLENMSQHDAISLLELVQERKIRFFNPMEVFSIPRSKKADLMKAIPEFCVYMRRATVSPTGIQFHSPSVEISNRVVRYYEKYADRFIRVSFTDEKSSGRIRFTDKVVSNELFSRVFRTLNNGIVLGDRRYEFLAFGNSQLREHGAYFFARADDLTASDIRDWMGHFSNIRIIAKNASRLGQCFSTTKAFKQFKVEPSKIPDIERHGYCFSDGVGKMSPILAVLITAQLIGSRRTTPLNYRSSCFQFRLGGHKGVLVVNPELTNCEIQLRESQMKFWSPHKDLEIIRCSQFASASLNRQLIQVMSTLGVPDEFFRERLMQILSDYSTAISNPAKALELLTKHIDPNHMTLEIANMVRGGLMTSMEPFVISLMCLWRAWTIKYLKEKAKITIDDGAFLLGVVDETGILKGYYHDTEDVLPEVFCQVTDLATCRPRIITGPVIVARNPSLHPGDVRLVEAVDVPELHHLIDVVVFPQTGDRDIPSMLSGGDLDGDDYVVIWDKDLTAPGILINEPPASYKPHVPSPLDRDVTIQDITGFFVNYMKNDRLGAIANAHLAWADKSDQGVKSTICLDLATLHSDAVDYPKTGIKAVMGSKFRIRQWPHFFEKPVEESSYHSTKILGQLYDMVERVEFKPCYDLPPNEYLMTAFNLTDAELDEAKHFKNEYDRAMRRIMAQHEIQTEFEVWSTFVMLHSNGNDYKFHEEIGEISFSLKDRFRKQIIHSCTNRTTQLLRKVVAMYVVTQRELAETLEKIEQDRNRATPRAKSTRLSVATLSKKELETLPLVSFPWLFPELLVDVTRGRTSVAQDYSGPDHCDVSPVNDDDVEIQDLDDDEDEAEAGDIIEVSGDSEDEDEDLEQGEEYDDAPEQFDGEGEISGEDVEVPIEEIDDDEALPKELDSDQLSVEESVSIRVDEAASEETEAASEKFETASEKFEKFEAAGDENDAAGDKTDATGDKTEAAVDKTDATGDKTEAAVDKTEKTGAAGDETAAASDRIGAAGDKIEAGPVTPDTHDAAV